MKRSGKEISVLLKVSSHTLAHYELTTMRARCTAGEFHLSRRGGQGWWNKFFPMPVLHRSLFHVTPAPVLPLNGISQRHLNLHRMQSRNAGTSASRIAWPLRKAGPFSLPGMMRAMS